MLYVNGKKSRKTPCGRRRPPEYNAGHEREDLLHLRPCYLTPCQYENMLYNQAMAV